MLEGIHIRVQLCMQTSNMFPMLRSILLAQIYAQPSTRSCAMQNFTKSGHVDEWGVPDRFPILSQELQAFGLAQLVNNHLLLAILQWRCIFSGYLAIQVSRLNDIQLATYLQLSAHDNYVMIYRLKCYSACKCVALYKHGSNPAVQQVVSYIRYYSYIRTQVRLILQYSH